jgi:hypothetical protein
LFLINATPASIDSNVYKENKKKYHKPHSTMVLLSTGFVSAFYHNSSPLTKDPTVQVTEFKRVQQDTKDERLLYVDMMDMNVVNFV